MREFRNNKTNEIVTTELSKAEIAAEFAASAPDNHWVWFWLVKSINDFKSARPETTNAIAFLADSFLYAVGMGLKKPSIRLHWQNRRYKLYLSPRGTLCFKSGNIEPGTNKPVGNEVYMGCLRNGKFLPPRDRKPLPTENDFLANLEKDPSGFLAQVSKDMDRCCYCNLPLEDQRSKQAGYGKVCAERWGLPWGKDYDEKVPSFAQLWSRSDPQDRRSIRGLCKEIRQKPRDEFLWELLADALQDMGFVKRIQMPDEDDDVVIPSGE